MARKIILQKAFFDRPPLLVARELLGTFLVRKINGKEIALMITETEAYDGERDLACHARAGKTGRNYPMFGPPGYSYVYFTYGMHWMLNIVTGPGTHPSATLIRGAGDVIGPARLTKFLHIDKSLNNQRLGRKSGLWIEDRGVVIPASKIRRTSRIGVQYAGKWALKPWRFVIKESQKNKKKRRE